MGRVIERIYFHHVIIQFQIVEQVLIFQGKVKELRSGKQALLGTVFLVRKMLSTKISAK